MVAAITDIAMNAIVSLSTTAAITAFIVIMLNVIVFPKWLASVAGERLSLIYERIITDAVLGKMLLWSPLTI